MTTNIDQYLLNGCMRCELGATPACKINTWREVVQALRQLVLDCGLEERMKWGVPCYTLDNKNVVMVSAFKDYASLSFFKGSLLKDPRKLLHKPGENSQAARLAKFTRPDQVWNNEQALRNLIKEAVQIEQSGQRVVFKKIPDSVPEELTEAFEQSPELEKAFRGLTPGRQRGYILYFSQPKQSQTRHNRIEKCRPKILAGEGLHDAYKRGK